MKPLEPRPYKLKNPELTFFCPLCRSERAITVRPRLAKKHFIQIGLLTIVFMMFTFPWLELVSLASFFLFWAIFEIGVRLVFKKELPCPYCGFDASWYKKNVPKAREKVKEFWDKKNQAKVVSNG